MSFKQKHIDINICYKVIAILLCMMAVLELVFQYRFQTRFPIVYFLLFLVVCVWKIKHMITEGRKDYLGIFDCLWPALILLISFISSCKFALLPFVISAFLIVFYGKFRIKSAKIISLALNLLVLVLYGLFWGISSNIGTTEVVGEVSSPDHQYIAILEEMDLGATGGNVTIYVGRNLDFGVLGRLIPVKKKYYWC